MKKSKSLLKISAAALGVLHCINKLIDSTVSGNTAAKSSGKYYHWKHGDIFYHVSGEGTPLLLIHDLNAFSSSYEWKQIAKALAGDYKVYTIDLIGCGKSDRPCITYTNFFYVQMISDFVKDVIGEKTDIAANGLSSSFVLMANALNDKLFGKIMMINPKKLSVLKNTPNERSKILLRLFDLPIVGKSAYYIAANKTNIEYYLTEKVFYNPFEVTPGIVKAYYDNAHTSKGNGKALLASLEGNYLNVDITQSLKNTSNDMMIVNGMHNEYKDDIVASYRRINENIEVDEISGSKLLPQIESYDEMLETMYRFF
ncbi:MAG TPA: alpha/beta hydrolase [Lachnospiraceae bacterium]|nr:alpha/beta hydrolase [Lachnospiraceae bacterium]